MSKLRSCVLLSFLLGSLPVAAAPDVREGDPPPPPPRDVWGDAFQGAPPEIASPDSPNPGAGIRNGKWSSALLAGPVLRWPTDADMATGGFFRLRLEYNGVVDVLSNQQKGNKTKSYEVGVLVNLEIGLELLSDRVVQVPWLARLGVGFGPIHLTGGLGWNTFGAKGPIGHERVGPAAYLFTSMVAAFHKKNWEVGVELRLTPDYGADYDADAEMAACEEEHKNDSAYTCSTGTPMRSVALGLYYAWFF